MALLGCEDDSVVSTTTPEILTVSISGVPDELIAPVGALREVPFTVTAIRTDGSTAPGVMVYFTVGSGEGTITPSEAITDAEGQVDALLRLQMPEVSSAIQIIASAADHAATKTIQLVSTGKPQRLTLTADASRITVPSGQSGSINILALVTDSSGVGIPATNIGFALRPIVEGGEIFGSISAPEPTNDLGNCAVTFNSGGGFGDLILHAEVEEPGLEETVEADIALQVSRLEGEIGFMSVAANPNSLVVPIGEQGTSQLEVQVLDSNRHAIPDLRVNFTTDIGGIDSDAITDERGVGHATFSSNFEYGNATVTALIPNTIWSRSVEIEIDPDVPIEGSISLAADRNFIYADFGITTASLIATLVDGEGRVIEGAEITFRSTHGSVTSPVVTDDLGRAVAIFTDIGHPSVDDEGNPVPAVITARYRPAFLEASAEVMILSPPDIEVIELETSNSQLVAGRDSTAVRVTCYLENGDPGHNGTVIYFSARTGSFTHSDVALSGGFGVARTTYIAGSQVGVDTLIAYAYNGEERERIGSNIVTIILIAGPPHSITLVADPPTLPPGGGSSVVTATITDAYNNPVRAGTYVSFSASFGTITSSSVTDEYGRAEAVFYSGVSSGALEITVIAGDAQATISIQIGAGNPSSISMRIEPPQIRPSGSGGVESATLTMTIHDSWGNRITQPTAIVLELVDEPDPPEGCSLNDEGHSVVVHAVQGLASAQLNAGTETGLKLIRAYSWSDPQLMDTIDVYSSILVTGGYPAALDIDVDDEAIDAGGGSWSIEVSARVWDADHNPVIDNIPVEFVVDPEIADIGEGYTGNENRNGNSIPGVANVELVYPSTATFSLIRISARVRPPHGVVMGNRDHELPLQRGELSLHYDPAHWMFEEGSEEAIIRVWVVLRDGHRILIDRAPVLFNTNRGRYHWYNNRRNRYEEYYPEPARKLTGIIDEENSEDAGQATVFLIAEEHDVFLDPFTLEVSVRISAVLEGYGDVFTEPGFIFFTRHAR